MIDRHTNPSVQRGRAGERGAGGVILSSPPVGAHSMTTHTYAVRRVLPREKISGSLTSCRGRSLAYLHTCHASTAATQAAFSQRMIYQTPFDKKKSSSSFAFLPRVYTQNGPPFVRGWPDWAPWGKPKMFRTCTVVVVPARARTHIFYTRLDRDRFIIPARKHKKSVRRAAFSPPCLVCRHHSDLCTTQQPAYVLLSAERDL